MSASRGSETLSVARLVGVNYELVHLFVLDMHPVQRQSNYLVLASVVYKSNIDDAHLPAENSTAAMPYTYGKTLALSLSFTDQMSSTRWMIFPATNTFYRSVGGMLIDTISVLKIMSNIS